MPLVLTRYKDVEKKGTATIVTYDMIAGVGRLSHWYQAKATILQGIGFQANIIHEEENGHGLVAVSTEASLDCIYHPDLSSTLCDL